MKFKQIPVEHTLCRSPFQLNAPRKRTPCDRGISKGSPEGLYPVHLLSWEGATEVEGVGDHPSSAMNNQESGEHPEILSKLGQGGMGTVYEGRQKSIGRTTAIKILPKNNASEEFRFAKCSLFSDFQCL
ncbi:MAG: hypothetical protein GXP30_11185 [Verrucomicrobia bacterium]|nr:hypothetical protein [Verrucomicrobiota bacterium]